jgi:methionyl-tRNA formyltransferase
LHPSPLPKYRGGSPIQHQIINGETKSAVTFFKMTEKLDAGPILYQQEFSLEGNLKDVTLRIKDLAIRGIFYILNNNNVIMSAQDESEVTFYKRRTPAESEIFVDDFKKYTAEELYNKIRCLQDPYPNAYVTCKDGKKLFIQLANYQKEK